MKLPSPVSKWSNHQPVRATNRLVHVGKVDVGDGDDAGVRVLVEVETRLLQPLKVIHRLDVHTYLQRKTIIKFKHMLKLLNINSYILSNKTDLQVTSNA